MKKRWIVATILCLSLNTLAFSISDLETIRKRVLEEILVSSVDDAEVENVLNSMSEDGSWSSINYEDVSRTAFEHRTHLTNMLLMANAFNLKQSKFYRDKKLKKALATSLDFWVQNDFICENWWYNQIGVPTTLVNINMLMDKHLPEDLVAKTQPIIGRAHLNASGARPSGDRIKIAAILATNLLYNRKEDEFSEVMKVIEGEIKFSTGSRGMQQDYSFHHREDRVNNTLSYGTDYAYAFAKWATFVRGTGYAFSEEKINILVDYYLDGICKQMVFGKSPDPAAKNRSIARPNAIKPNDASMARKLISCTDYRKDELQENIDICTKDAKPTQSFAKFFWQAEHFSFQRPTYYTSVRMYSTRNYNMEWPYNGEGLLNHYRGDGVNHISITGMECADIWPVYDYQKIPGTTILQKPEMDSEDDVQKPGLTDFVGAVTDSMYAAVAFDFRSPHDDVKAKKSWFFFDDIYVCLGAGISSWSKFPMATTLNQTYLNGEVTVWDSNGENVLKNGEHSISDVKKVFHDGIGYIFNSPETIHLKNNTATGGWFKINRQTVASKEEVNADVFKLWIEHAPRSQDANYEYMIVPATTVEKLRAEPEKQITVLQNSSEIQAVKHQGQNLYQVVFYKSGEIQLADNMTLSSDSPGLYMIQMDGDKPSKITVSDPNRELGKIHFSVSCKLNSNDEKVQTRWNSEKDMTDFAIDLPQGVYAGSSYVLSF